MHTKNSIQNLIDKSDKALLRGLQVIYALQTADEKALKVASATNGVGFSKAHAEFATSLAQQLDRKGYLSPKQIAALRKMMKRYAGQLARVANGEIPNPLAPKPASPVVMVAQEILADPNATPNEVEKAQQALQKLEW